MINNSANISYSNRLSDILDIPSEMRNKEKKTFCFMDTCIMDTCIVDTCTVDTCVVGLSAKGCEGQSQEGPKGQKEAPWINASCMCIMVTCVRIDICIIHACIRIKDHGYMHYGHICMGHTA